MASSASASATSASLKVVSKAVASRRKLNVSDSCYNARHDLGTDGAARGVEAAVGAAAALRPDLAAGAADDRGALPRVGARAAVGVADARGDDRRLHLPLRRGLRRAL